MAITNMITSFIGLNLAFIDIRCLGRLVFSFHFSVILNRSGAPHVLPLGYNGYSSCKGKFHSEFVDSDIVLVKFWINALFSPFCLHQ